jgi:hypothetical protein
VHRIFLLSPANAGGQRAQFIFNPKAGFPLARQLQGGDAVSLGEIFRFLSGLYFRGKLAYAETYARPPPGSEGAFVITSNRGLLPVHTPTTLAELRAFAGVPIDPHDPRYEKPLRQSARQISPHANCEFVLLGSISTGKYVDILLDVFGERLFFPLEFVGRGDMSRGGLMLRAVRDLRELTYQRIAGAVRRGSRPPKLVPHSWQGTPWAAARGPFL